MLLVAHTFFHKYTTAFRDSLIPEGCSDGDCTPLAYLLTVTSSVKGFPLSKTAFDISFPWHLLILPVTGFTRWHGISYASLTKSLVGIWSHSTSALG